MASNNPNSLVYSPDHAGDHHKSRRNQLASLFRDVVRDINWCHLSYKFCAYAYIFLFLYILWLLIVHRDGGHGVGRTDRIPIVYKDFSNYFGSFRGYSECDIKASDLYRFPPRNERAQVETNAFCSNRKTLLQAMSAGGRIGFDAPYTGRGCQYRWYAVEEICMILERFDNIVFVGDSTLQTVFNGFNILIRRDLRLGALRSWDMDEATLIECQCDNQFVKQSCIEHSVKSSSEITTAKADHVGLLPACKRTPFIMFDIDTSPASNAIIDNFKTAVPRVPRSNYKPVPIIHSLSPSMVSKEVASSSLLEFLKLADDSKRKTPMLWVGPTAAGHIEIKNRKGNQEIWDFDSYMARKAQENDVEVLRMWNMTVQANSYDGLRFGEKVAITQAMMIVNWLGCLESS